MQNTKDTDFFKAPRRYLTPGSPAHAYSIMMAQPRAAARPSCSQMDTLQHHSEISDASVHHHIFILLPVQASGKWTIQILKYNVKNNAREFLDSRDIVWCTYACNQLRVFVSVFVSVYDQVCKLCIWVYEWCVCVYVSEWVNLCECVCVCVIVKYIRSVISVPPGEGL